MLITEKEIKSLLKEFPTDSWLRKYVAYASKLTTSPMAYHLGVGLAVLSAVIPQEAGTPFAGGHLPSTFYTIVVGRSGDDQKSTAIKIGQKILFDIDAGLIGDKPASMEGAIESLSQKEKQILFYSEMGNFLSSTKSGYGEQIKTLFTDLWDGTPQQRAKSGEVIRVSKPRLNLVGACAINYLEAFTTEEDWHGGFLARWFFLHAHRERSDSFPMRKQIVGREWLVTTLQKAKDEKIGRCIGITDDFYKLWDDWYYEIEKRDLPKIISGLKTRIPAHCLRVVTLLSWESGKCNGNTYKLDSPELILAIKVIEMYIRSIISISKTLCFDEGSRNRKRIMAIIKEKEASTYSQLLSSLKLSQRALNEALNWLVAADKIKTSSFSNTKIYQIKK